MIAKRIYQALQRWTTRTHDDHHIIPGTCCAGDNVAVGKNVSFGGNVFLFGTAPITIGDHSMIGYGTIIHTSTHDYNLHPMWIKRIDRPVQIGKHVWIGTGAIILPGVIIEDYSVVGAGSVVTKHVPRGSIVAGNPAVIIKSRDLDKLDPDHADVPDYPEGATTVQGPFLPKSCMCNKQE